MAWNWGISIIAFAFGLGIGFLVAYLVVPRNARTEALEQELRAAQTDHAEYRGKVNQHFQTTAELFADMTDRYRAVYQHMASGAQSLCEERAPALQLEIVDRAHAAAVSGPSAAPAAPSSSEKGEPETEFDLQLSTAPHASLGASDADSDEYLGDAPRVPELTDEVVLASASEAKPMPR